MVGIHCRVIPRNCRDDELEPDGVGLLLFRATPSLTSDSNHRGEPRHPIGEGFTITRLLVQVSQFARDCLALGLELALLSIG